MMEKNATEIPVHFVDSFTLKSCIQYYRTGLISINKFNLQKIILAADYLQMPKVLDKCAKFISGNLKVKNYFTIMKMAEKYPLAYNRLRMIFFNFIRDNFNQIVYRLTFLNFTAEEFFQILSDNFLNANELAINFAIRKWIQHQFNFNKNEFNKIFQCIHSEFTNWSIESQNLFCIINTIGKLNRNSEYKTDFDYDIIRLNGKSGKKRMPFFHKLSHSILAIGGLDRNKSLNKYCEYFDPITCTWNMFEPKLNQNRHSFGLTLMDNHIFVIGGLNEFNNRLNSVEYYDPIGKKWKLTTSMNTLKFIYSVSSLNGKIYVFGRRANGIFFVFN